MELALNADGSLTLGADIMARLGFGAGQRVALTRTAQGGDISPSAHKNPDEEMFERLQALRETNAASDPIDELQTFMETQSRALDNGIHASLEEIQEAIARGYVEHGMRGLE